MSLIKKNHTYFLDSRKKLVLIMCFHNRYQMLDLSQTVSNNTFFLALLRLWLYNIFTRIIICSVFIYEVSLYLSIWRVPNVFVSNKQMSSLCKSNGVFVQN